MSVKLEIKNETEGEFLESSDFCFHKIGEPVPLKHVEGDNDSKPYDLESLPSQPLAVSEQFRLVFVAHSSGFCVVRIGDVVESAEDIKKRGSGKSLMEMGIVDVSIGKVRILSVSPDSSMLAASVDEKLYIFSVSSFLNKEQKPLFTCSIDEGSVLKDMRWLKKVENSYVLLTNHGVLYYGNVGGPVKCVMENVDAVECSLCGSYVAVAKSNMLSILSSKFKEKVCVSLSSESWVGDPNEDRDVKVDSIKWIRRDCIVLGCYQLTSDGMEENYLVQVIRSKDGKITHASTEMEVQFFSDIFLGIVDDIVPPGGGPYLFLSYLSKCNLAVVANRKNMDDHIRLLYWKDNEAVLLDIMEDLWRPRIGIQENGDDNLILGLCTDTLSVFEKVTVKLGVETRELSPFCLLLCLTVEGKLVIFKVISMESFDSPEAALLTSDEEDTVTAKSLEIALPIASSGFEDGSLEKMPKAFQFQEIRKVDEETGVGGTILKDALKPYQDNGLSVSIPTTSQIEYKGCIKGKEEVKLIAQLQASEANGQQKVQFTKELEEDDSSKQWNFPGQGPAFNQSTSKFSVPFGSQHIRDARIADAPETYGPTKSLAEQSRALDRCQVVQNGGGTGNKVSSTTTGLTISPFQTSPTVDVASDNNFGLQLRYPSDNFDRNKVASTSFSEAAKSISGTPVEKPSPSKTTGVTLAASERAHEEIQNFEPLPSIHNLQLLSQGNFAFETSSVRTSYSSKENQKFLSPGVSKMDPSASKQYGNIKEMIGELDTLLSSIEEKGGFRDACLMSQKGLVEGVERGMDTLSRKYVMWEGIMADRLVEVQHLLDKTVQVMARKVYMEGIIKQAADAQYWELWSRQKLNTELELKRRHMLKLNHDLTNQLIELERYFNTLEFHKFGNSSSACGGRQPIHSRSGSSRYVQSLYSLCSTMNSQLAAAEQLSDRLSKQMAALSVDSPPLRPKNIKKELFDSIGIAYDSSFSSPDSTKASDIPSATRSLLSLNSASTRKQSKQNQLSAVKSSEPESARRRRDSLDQSWASFKPSKTTVKRMLLQGPGKSSTSQTFSSVDKQQLSLERLALSRSKDAILPSTLPHSLREVVHETRGERASRSPSTPIGQASGFATSTGLNSQKNSISDSSLMSASNSSISDWQNKIHSSNVIGKERGSGVAIEKLASSALDQTRSKMQPEGSFPQRTPLSLKSPLETTLLKITSDESAPIGRDTALTKMAYGSLEHEPKINESSLFGKAASSSSTEAIPMSSILPEKVLHAGPPLHKSLPGEVTTSAAKIVLSTMPPAVSPSSAAETLSTTSSIKSSLSPKGSLEGPWTIGRATADAAYLVPSKSSSVSLSSAASDVIASSSSFSLPSSSPPLFPFQIDKITMPSSTTSPSITSGSESQGAEVQTDKTLVNLVLDKGAKEGPASEAKSPIVDSFTSESGLKVDSSVLPSQKVDNSSTGEISVEMTSSTPVSISNVVSPASSMALNIQKEHATDVHLVFPTSVSTSESNNDQKAETLLVTAVQEDEMEEEAPETNNAPDLGLGSLGGFGIGSSNAITPKGNPFGAAFGNAAGTMTNSPFALSVPSGELFRPASFSFQPQQASQPSQPPNLNAFSGGFVAGGNAQPPTQSGFGQPAHIGGPGQQALGSVLGGFGQSRQLGSSLPGAGFASSSGFGGGFVGGSTSSGISSSSGVGGFATVGSSGGGFAALASGGGFAGAAPSGGGFAGAAPSGGGFAGAAPGGGFAGTAPAGGFGGFAAAASAGNGFAGAASGSGFSAAGAGFGAFSSQQGTGGFSAFGGGAGGTNKPPELFTQMRK